MVFIKVLILENEKQGRNDLCPI